MMWGKHRTGRILSIFLLLTTSAFAQRSLEVTYDKTKFDITVTQGDLSATDAELQTYIQQGAQAVATYFGKFPVDHMTIRIRAVRGDRVRFGRSSPNATIMMMIGEKAHADAFSHDWTLTHEMVHQAFPATKGDNHDWLSEGMATYVEPIARAQAGLISEKEVWRQFVDYMPRGIPNPGDGGIDDARGFKRIYWGGALFCLMADIQIRQATHNRKGLQDAFRAIMRQGGTMEWEWPINTIFETGDKATGTKVLEDLYRDWKEKPVEVDLPKLWRELGVEKNGDEVIFHDDAPLAAIRKAITAKH